MNKFQYYYPENENYIENIYRRDNERNYIENTYNKNEKKNYVGNYSKNYPENKLNNNEGKIYYETYTENTYNKNEKKNYNGNYSKNYSKNRLNKNEDKNYYETYNKNIFLNNGSELHNKISYIEKDKILEKERISINKNGIPLISYVIDDLELPYRNIEDYNFNRERYSGNSKNYKDENVFKNRYRDY